MKRVRVLIVAMTIVLTACVGGGDLASVKGMNANSARCVTTEVDGRIDDDRLVQIVAAEVEPSAQEEEIVTLAFINCVS